MNLTKLQETILNLIAEINVKEIKVSEEDYKELRDTLNNKYRDKIYLTDLIDGTDIYFYGVKVVK